jgi:hypothetical protein
MTVTIVSRWKVGDAAEATSRARRAKSAWVRNGAQECRLSTLLTGPQVGQMLFVSVFADLAAYGKASASIQADAEWVKLQVDIRKSVEDRGDNLEEREILVGIDI